jgi:hypothetical protein
MCLVVQRHINPNKRHNLSFMLNFSLASLYGMQFGILLPKNKLTYLLPLQLKTAAEELLLQLSNYNKIQLSLCLRHIRSGGIAPPFLTLPLDGGEC